MTDLRKAAEQALEALEKQHNWMVANGGGEMFSIPSREAVQALRQALAQPEQEPVAWMGVDSYGNVTKFRTNEFGGGIPLYTAPPKKKWVGLSDDEVSDILDREIGFNSCWGPETDFARAIEQALKEKNT